jgi:lipoprotein-anchoring transpeptidase ErfK/SrfK
MRLHFCLAAAAFAAACLPAQAANNRHSPDAFEIIGGLGNQPALEVQRPHKYRGKRIIPFDTSMEPGSVLVRTGERKLYYILPGNRAIRYAVGVGRDGFTWSGSNTITRKATWPDWRPPKVMIEREHAKGHMIPDFMKGGPGNPLGARAIYIGDTEFRIHGTNQSWSIGLAVSSGCIRMLNAEVIDLYNRVQVGANVVVE